MPGTPRRSVCARATLTFAVLLNLFLSQAESHAAFHVRQHALSLSRTLPSPGAPPPSARAVVAASFTAGPSDCGACAVAISGQLAAPPLLFPLRPTVVVGGLALNATYSVSLVDAAAGAGCFCTLAGRTTFSSVADGGFAASSMTRAAFSLVAARRPFAVTSHFMRGGSGIADDAVTREADATLTEFVLVLISIILLPSAFRAISAPFEPLPPRPERRSRRKAAAWRKKTRPAAAAPIKDASTPHSRTSHADADPAAPSPATSWLSPSPYAGRGSSITPVALDERFEASSESKLAAPHAQLPEGDWLFRTAEHAGRALSLPYSGGSRAFSIEVAHGAFTVSGSPLWRHSKSAGGAAARALRHRQLLRLLRGSALRAE